MFSPNLCLFCCYFPCSPALFYFISYWLCLFRSSVGADTRHRPTADSRLCWPCWWGRARWAGRRSCAAVRCSRCTETLAWTLRGTETGSGITICSSSCLFSQWWILLRCMWEMTCFVDDLSVSMIQRRGMRLETLRHWLTGRTQRSGWENKTVCRCLYFSDGNYRLFKSKYKEIS